MRRLAWILTAALVVLLARSLAYALAPGPLAQMLRGEAGGPRLPVVALVALGLGLGLASAVVWLAALGVRERSALEGRPSPPLRLGRALVRFACLSAATMVAFDLLESYLHWRAGLGWHGIHCLVGPVHSDALPILGALSLVATAAFTAVEHVLAWMRRTLALLRTRDARAAGGIPALLTPEPLALGGRVFVASRAARAPPLSFA
jgi:hypothetical protein